MKEILSWRNFSGRLTQLITTVFKVTDRAHDSYGFFSSTKLRNSIHLPLECRHSSVDSSAPTILSPRVRVPSTLSMLLSFIVKFVLYLSCEKNENKQKDAGFGPYFLKTFFTKLVLCNSVHIHNYLRAFCSSSDSSIKLGRIFHLTLTHEEWSL